VGVVGTPNKSFVIFTDLKALVREGRGAHRADYEATRHHIENCTNSLAPPVGTTLFLQQKIKSVMVNTRCTNPGQNNTQEDAESIGPEAQIANLNQQLA
jgi:hypothetical protein